MFCNIVFFPTKVKQKISSCLKMLTMSKYFLNWPLFNLFSSFQTHFTIFTTTNFVHPVNGAGIRTHDLWNMSLLPLPPLSQYLFHLLSLKFFNVFPLRALIRLQINWTSRISVFNQDRLSLRNNF